jgi:hypothetical protein
MDAPVAFLSHSSENSSIAKRVATDLRSQGVDTWFDQWEIRPGDSLRQKIDEGIEKASFFLVLLTPESLKSKWVQVELDAGMVKRIQGTCRLIPILLGVPEEQLPPTLRGIVWVRLDDYREGLRQLIEVCHGIKTKPPLGPSPRRDASPAGGTEEIAMPREEPEASKYASWVATMRHANRDGQLVGIVANFGHTAPQFNGKQKMALPPILYKYLDVRGFKPPLVAQNYIQFEFLPAQDGRRVWLQADRDGTLGIEVWRSWSQVPWDWILAEGFSMLVCLRDSDLMKLFQTNKVAQATLTLGNLVGTGGVASDVDVTTRGLVSNLIPSGEEVRGQRLRIPSVQYDCGAMVNTDPWGCAKAFVKQVLADTGVLLFEDRLEAVDKDTFLGVYFDTALGPFRRPVAKETRA